MSVIPAKLYRKILVAIVVAGLILTGAFYFWLKYSSLLYHRATGENQPPVFLTLFQGSGSLSLSRPLGISTADGKLYVANNNGGRIDIFLPNGKRLRSFHTTPKKTLAQNVGIAVDWVGKVYVGDVANSSVKVFDDKGEYLYWFPKPLPGMPVESPFVQPIGLFSDGKALYVVDGGDSSVKIFSTTGKMNSKFGKNGSGDGEMSFPHSVAILDNGDYVVTDSNNSRVLIFDKSGKYKEQLEQPKTEDKRPWLLPRGVAVDGYGRIHVVDNFAHRVHVYNKEKKYLFSYGGKDDRNTEGLNFPNGIAIDRKLRLIYVTDTGNNRIIVWGY